MVRDVAADLCAIEQRIAPVQAGPNPRIIDLVHQSIQIGVSSLRPDQLRNRNLARRQCPSDFARAEKSGDCIRNGRAYKGVSRRIFRVIDRDQGRPGRVRIGVRIIVAVSPGYCRSGTPTPIKIFRLKAGDARIGPSGIHHREKACGVQDVQVVVNHKMDQAFV